MVSYAGTDLPPMQRKTVTAIERLLTRRKINKAVAKYHATKVSEDSYFRTVAEILNLSVNSTFHAENPIPAEGPLLVVANHPYGIVDGLSIASIIESVRSDLKIIVWDAIDVPAPERHFIPLDLAENSFSARKQNALMRRKSVEYLKAGGAILIFPSGSAERAPHPLGKPAELPWTPLAGRLAIESSANVLPVFVGGHNSRLFHAASFFGDTVRRGLFLHETARLIDSSVDLTVSPVVSQETIARIGDANTVCQHLREALYWDHKAPNLPCNETVAEVADDAQDYLNDELITNQPLGIR